MRSWLRRLRLAFPLLALASLPLVIAPDAIAALAAHVLVTNERGELAAAAITSTTLGAANTILTTTKPSVQLMVDTDCTVPFMLVRNGANFKRLFAGKGYVIDLKSNAVAYGASTWKVYYTGAAPAGCTLEVVSIPPI
jgi:hypothetical protein